MNNRYEWYKSFKLTLPCGERLLSVKQFFELFPFKLTLPCGERREYAEDMAAFMDLNSRSPVGSDQYRPPQTDFTII